MKGEGGRGEKGMPLLHCCSGITAVFVDLPARAAEEPVRRDQGKRQREDETKGREAPRFVKLHRNHPAPPANLHGTCMSKCKSGLFSSLRAARAY